MSEAGLFAALLAGLVLGVVLGWLLARLRLHREVQQLRDSHTALSTTLEMERKTHAEKLALFEQARADLAGMFASLSSQALKHNSDEFLKLAQENLKQFHVQAQGSLTQKEQAIQNLLQPIREALTKTEEQIRAIEKERKEAYGSITRHLETLAQTQQLLQGETRNLVQALRRPEVRGQWGELTLKRLAELAGMAEHCDFVTQEQVGGGAGALRPDMVIRLPGKREIIVDVKTPLDAYLSAVEASDDAQRQQFLDKHAQNVRNRVRELASKAYWTQFAESPDFVVLFIPGDQFLSTALDKDPALLEEALSQKVILATPTSLVALLRAVGFGWQQQVLAENAEKVRDAGVDLYKRLAAFTEHFARLGKNLHTTVENFNRSVGSFERSVLPGARRLAELGIDAKKDLETIEPVEASPRAPLAATPEDDPERPT